MFLLPVDDTASIAKEPNSELSGTLQEPHIHASQLHFPVQVSSAPGKTNRQSRSDVIGELSLQRQFQGEILLFERALRALERLIFVLFKMSLMI